MNQTVEVPVRSAWLSKINWAQLISLIAMLLTLFGIDFPKDVQLEIISMITGVNVVGTWVLRTWFTNSVTPAVAKKL
jgi:hypothetical protein